MSEEAAVMGLWVITNNYVGESYVRVYAWAHNEDEAIELARQQYRNNPGVHGERYSKYLSAELLFSSLAPAFATIPSDDGFDLECVYGFEVIENE